MANLRKLGREMVKAKNPELYETLFDSMSALFGQLVLTKRMQNGLSQDELASQAGTTQKTISRIEGGNSNVTMDTYQKVFKILDVSKQEVADALLKKAERGNKPLVGTY